MNIKKSNANPLSSADLEAHTIRVMDPFSEFLRGTPSEYRFTLSLLDVVRFSGHACPSVVGAFLTTAAAIKTLFPESDECVRGLLEIDMPASSGDGAAGPMANVFGYITGAWSATGFPGLKGRFTRKNLLRFAVQEVPAKAVRFRRKDNNHTIDVIFDTSGLNFHANPEVDFQTQWRQKVGEILKKPELVISVIPVRDSVGSLREENR